MIAGVRLTGPGGTVPYSREARGPIPVARRQGVRDTPGRKEERTAEASAGPEVGCGDEECRRQPLAGRAKRIGPSQTSDNSDCSGPDAFHDADVLRSTRSKPSSEVGPSGRAAE